MPNKPILATYIGGVFQPVDPESLELPEGQNVTLEITPIDRATYILTLAKEVYSGLSAEEIAEIEQVIARRPLFTNDLANETDEEIQSQGQTA